ncbi:MAG: aminoacyl-tRNA hydrolase, partial [Hoeflea sp.]|nr:aminoacyl-tRNA hydrolase [Hoeflea sp.]
ALATGVAEAKPAKEPKPGKLATEGGKPAPAKSHIRQARTSAQPKALPTSGPMADMLKRLFGKKDE